MTSAVDICNRALQKLGESPITSLTEDSDRARECNRAYEAVRDAELRSRPWNFARTRVELAASSTPPAFGYANAFPLPSDFLRLYPGNTVSDWQIESGSILTDDAAPLQIVYIRREEDPNKYDPLFREALAAKLAVEMAERLTQSGQKRQLAIAEYDRAIQDAGRLNAFERVSVEPPEDVWVTVRRSGRYGDRNLG